MMDIFWSTFNIVNSQREVACTHTLNMQYAVNIMQKAVVQRFAPPPTTNASHHHHHQRQHKQANKPDILTHHTPQLPTLTNPHPHRHQTRIYPQLSYQSGQQDRRHLSSKERRRGRRPDLRATNPGGGGGGEGRGYVGSGRGRGRGPGRGGRDSACVERGEGGLAGRPEAKASCRRCEWFS